MALLILYVHLALYSVKAYYMMLHSHYIMSVIHYVMWSEKKLLHCIVVCCGKLSILSDIFLCLCAVNFTFRASVISLYGLSYDVDNVMS